jgi:[methyl-Co(III) methanol-specific corrinoid protein]:coenzyme M methyltransferase
MLADHATRDLCSPAAYRDFLKGVHAELSHLLPCPVVLHICGDTSDRIGMIAETGLACFHWDTKLGDAHKARELAGDGIALMGGINNTEVLRRGSVELIEARCGDAVSAGIDIVAPECAVPLDTPMRNLVALGRCVARLRSRRRD